MRLSQVDPEYDSSDEEEWQGFSDEEEWQGFNDDPGDTPLQPLQPPPDAIFYSIDEAMLAANMWAEHRGYAMVKGRAKYRESDGTEKKIWACCDRYGKPRYTDDPTMRKRPNRGSRKCECKMAATIAETYKGSGFWQFTVIKGAHNHDPTTEPGSHPAIRKMYKNDKFKEIIATHKAAGILARDTLTAQLLENPSLPLTRRDYHNERAALALKESAGRSSIHTLLDSLNTHDEFYSDHQTANDDGSGALTHLFISHHKHGKLLAQNPEILVIDSTYKTNRYDMPLVNIVGTTPLNKSFYAASAFMQSETVDDFVFMFEALKRMYDDKSLPYPETFVSDADPQQMKAMQQVFPGVNHVLCLWHINSNIHAKILPLLRAKYGDSGEETIAEFVDRKWKEVKTDWLHAINASSEEKWEENWKAFCDKYDEQYPSLIRYIRRKIVNKHKERIVKFWTDKHLNWGMKTSSKAESLHSKLKSELGNSRGEIKYVVDQFRLLLRRLYRNIATEHQKEGMNLRARLLRAAFSQVNRKVTAYALEKVITQMERLRPCPRQKEVKLPPCTHLFRSAYGLPCAHEIKPRMDLNEPLKVEDFHRHWWFNKTTVENVRPEGFERVLNPNMAKAKGRPPGAPNKKKSNKAMSTTERDSSQHEVLLAEVTGDSSQLRGIHRGKRVQKPPVLKRKRNAAAAKEATITNKRNIETIDLTASPRRKKRPRLSYLSDSSSDGEINEEATDDTIEEATEEATEEVIDDVPYQFPAELIVDGNNAEIIESPVRLRRSGRERQATRKSLDYHKEMRKGR